MSIKIVFFPLSVLITIIGSIFWIYPIYNDVADSVSGKKVQLAKEEAALNQVKQRNRNAQSLVSDMDTHSEKVKEVLDYMPTTIEDEHIITSLEGLVAKSGSSLTDISKSDTGGGSSVSTVVQNTSNEMLMGENGEMLEGDLDIAQAPELEPESTTYSLTLFGSYESLRSFVGNVERFFRNAKIDSLAITTGESDSEEEGAITDVLSLAIDIQFGFAKDVKLADTEASPVFQKSSFDFTVVDEYRAQFTESYLEASVDREAARVNPFLP